MWSTIYKNVRYCNTFLDKIQYIGASQSIPKAMKFYKQLWVYTDRNRRA